MSDTEMTVLANGPIRIQGSFVIQDAEGSRFDLAGRTAIALCRCGSSEDKPFCDGSHRRVGFQSEVKARKLSPPKS